MTDNTQPTTPAPGTPPVQPAAQGASSVQTPPPVYPGPGAPAQPHTPAAQPGGTPDGGGQPPAAPFRVFNSQKELDEFVVRSKQQAERAAVRKLAKDLGFEDADELREALEPLRRGQGQGAANAPADPPATPAQLGPTEAQLIALKLQVAAAKNLPVTLVNRLQGTTQQELEADADQLLGLVATRPPGPGIPPAPQQGTPVTFTRAQLSDPAFVRANQDAIRQAAKDGRIVRS